MTPAEETVRYIERTRGYYRALGYPSDYVWATHDTVPFARLDKPLREATVALITTAHPPDLHNKDARGVRHVWSGRVDPVPAGLNTDNLAWDRESTHTQDRETYLPVQAMLDAVRDGVIGALAPRFHGVPTEYSQRKTNTEDAPQILARLREDRVDAVVLSAL